MSTIRLYRAVKLKQNVEALVDASTFNGGFGARKALPPTGELIAMQRKMYAEFTAALAEADSIMKGTPGQRANALRIAGERDVVRFLTKSLHDQGYMFEWDDGDGDVTISTSWLDAANAAFDLDQFVLTIKKPNAEHASGSFLLVFGNSPAEVIADYHTRLEELLRPTDEYIRDFYDADHIVETI